MNIDDLMRKRLFDDMDKIDPGLMAAMKVGPKDERHRHQVLTRVLRAFILVFTNAEDVSDFPTFTDDEAITSVIQLILAASNFPLAESYAMKPGAAIGLLLWADHKWPGQVMGLVGAIAELSLEERNQGMN